MVIVDPKGFGALSDQEKIRAYDELHKSNSSLVSSNTEAAERITDLEAILGEIGNEEVGTASQSQAKQAKLLEALKGVVELHGSLTKKVESIEKQQEGIARDNLEKYFEKNIPGYSELRDEAKDYIVKNPVWASNVKAIFDKGGTYADAARTMRDVVELIQMRKSKEESVDDKKAGEDTTNDVAEEAAKKVDPKKDMAMFGSDTAGQGQESQHSEGLIKTRTKELTQEDHSFYKSQMGLTDSQIEAL